MPIDRGIGTCFVGFELGGHFLKLGLIRISSIFCFMLGFLSVRSGLLRLLDCIFRCGFSSFQCRNACSGSRQVGLQLFNRLLQLSRLLLR